MQVFALRIGEILPGEIKRRASGDRSVKIEGGRRRRRDMVELPVILVKGQKKSRAAPNFWITGQSVERARGKFRALQGARGRWVLRPQRRRQDPGDLRQLILANVLRELFECPMAHALFV